ncbi:hypothetical protein PsYK624_034590 [Phanerochaete sordida]|uniref:Uncharacterized protein n=1 Tax=Phanerochaete sordida TaxID=48140 RepID=A0A9P3G359_9APHY|nr:hypothetical protein PsYK624_034590 [Phanerochaete sordida]
MSSYEDDEDMVSLSSDKTGESRVETLRDDVEKILTDHKLNWNSTFCLRKTYADAPNPVLSIEGFGEVGLPLTARDVKAIKRHGLQVGNKQNGASWEVDASKVTFASSRWPAYVEEVVKDVSNNLNPSGKKHHFRCELQKLSVYEKGSRLLQNTDSAATGRDLIATITVLLPSQYTGGAVRLSCDGVSVEPDYIRPDPGCTSVLAWLPAVEHDPEPITSGHALSLTYHLTRARTAQPSTSSTPAAAAQDRFAISELNRVFAARNFMVGSPGGPCKLVYLLDGDYYPGGALGVLSGADAERASAFDMLAGVHDLALGLVTVRYHPHLDSSRKHQDGGRSDALEYTRLVNAHSGEPLAPTLEVTGEEQIPRDIATAIRIRAFDRAPYDSTDAELDAAARRPRTALVVWPRRSHLDVVYSGRAGLERAWAALAATAEEPTADDRALVDFLLARESEDEGSAEACCKAALRWVDLDTWCKAVYACGEPLGLACVRDETKFEAVEVFGFESVRASFETMLNAEKRNSTRLAFLQSFDDWLGEPRAAAKGLVRHLRQWLKAQKEEVLTSLRTPSLNEAVLLLDAARESGGLSYLRTQMLPQLQVCADGEFLLHFAHTLHQATSWKERGKKEMTHDILAAGVSATFAPPASAVTERTAAADFAQCKAYTETCTRFGHGDLVDDIVKHVLASAARPDLSAAQGGEYARNAMIPFVNYLAPRTRRTTRLPRQFDELRRSAVELWRKWAEGAPGQLAETEIGELVDAAIFPDGDLGVFVAVLAPAVEIMKLPGPNFRDLVDALRRVPEPHVYPEDYAGPSLAQVIVSLARRYARKAPSGDAEVVTDAVQWVIAVDPLLGRAVFDSVLAEPKITVEYVKDVLMPMARALCQQATEGERLGTLAPLLQGIVKAWISTVPPSSDRVFSDGWRALRSWRCPCMHCLQLRNFFTKDCMESKKLSHIGAHKVTHVDRELRGHARHLAVWETRGTRPKGLMIYKSDALIRYHSWFQEKKEVEEILRAIGPDDAALQNILGAEYARVRTALEHGADMDLPSVAVPAKRRAEGIPLVSKRPRYGRIMGW